MLSLIWFVLTLQLPTSDPYPSAEGAPGVSFLNKACRLEATGGAHWKRLWLNCGAGPHLISEPSSFMWHATIDNRAKALELLGLFSSLESCERLPMTQWLQVTPSAHDGWLQLSERDFHGVCPVPESHEAVDASAEWKLFIVNRCLLNVQDGHVYVVEEHVRENGETTLVNKRLVLRDAARRLGSCSPPGAPVLR